MRDIRLEDLRRLSSLRALFKQAVAANWVSGSESDFQNFVAAAVRATRLDRESLRTADPVRVFVGIVRKRLWGHITAEQEERAREVIARDRVKNRVAKGCSVGQAINRLVDEVSNGLSRQKSASASVPA